MNYRLIPNWFLFLLVIIIGCAKDKQASQTFQVPKPAYRDKNPQVSFSDFIGAKQCQPCHGDIYAQWKNSTHAKAGGNPDEINIIAPFNGSPIRLADVTVYPEHENQEYQFRIVNNATQDEQILIVEAVVGGGFMIGGGTQTFFGKYEDGSYRFFPFDFSKDENIWFVQVKGSGEWKKADKNIGLDQLVNWPPHRVLGEIEDISNCQNCHGSQVIGQRVGNRYKTQFTSLGINCESCHGPAKTHVSSISDIVRSITSNTSDIGIKTLAGIFPKESLDVCLQCHAVKTPLKNGFLPGKNMEEFYSFRMALLGNENPYSIDGRIKSFGYQQNHLFSDCFINGTMTCTSCHNPHSQDYQDINRNTLASRFDDRQCTACHAAKAEDIPSHTFHLSGSEGSKCIACHMPFRQHVGIGNEIRFTRSDHTVSIPRPVYDQSQGFESACIQCHTNKPEAALQTYINEWWSSVKPLNPVIANRLRVTEKTSLAEATELLLRPDWNHSIGQFSNVSYFIKRYLSPGMDALNQNIINKLMVYAQQDDIDIKALTLAGLHYSQYKNPRVQLFIAEQLKTMGDMEESVRLRWGMILDYFGTVFYLIGDRPRAIECYELAKQVLPDDKNIRENLSRAKT
ncbi:MAG: multiheme c-type cytochrome [Candidatus Marinimicrobia bacterium]|jgi:hypothetical protein|nr:multiheme c-type cytochrome [Candidatus Neomarinimicrobiota bacterium]|tara:strand:- start:19392 stop:21266 length:1875 start_codon:yes stop_codon:yes gene_type:complete